jgi:hypothetical protein
MTLIQKLILAAAVFGALSIVIRKAWSYERSSRAESIPTLHAVEDAEPHTAEPLTQEQLRVAQNSPL